MLKVLKKAFAERIRESESEREEDPKGITTSQVKPNAKTAKKKPAIADHELDPTRNVWSLFFLASSSAHFDFGPQNKLLILFPVRARKMLITLCVFK